ncbi:hypothetical protein BpHYR1_025143 [Brachionus plicatilis]|uniref:Uncharacterized protein n=1 Tax=Brachionus plicatilis TaxID=10195 RepID=A0A3M7RS39_BRAPC|nr:hypothetical protein BpHYR1_025143 [Brachionus plicatilis]
MILLILFAKKIQHGAKREADILLKNTTRINKNSDQKYTTRIIFRKTFRIFEIYFSYRQISYLITLFIRKI